MDALDLPHDIRFQKIARAYADAKQHYHERIMPMQQRNLQMGNRIFGENKKVNVKAALLRIQQEFDDKAKTFAVSLGYKEEAKELQQTPEINQIDNDNPRSQRKENPTQREQARQRVKEEFLKQLQINKAQALNKDKELFL
jgi:hypothetical protein